MFRITDRRMFRHYDEICSRCVSGLLAFAVIANAAAVAVNVINAAFHVQQIEGAYLFGCVTYLIMMAIGIVILLSVLCWGSHQRKKYYVDG